MKFLQLQAQSRKRKRQPSYGHSRHRTALLRAGDGIDGRSLAAKNRGSAKSSRDADDIVGGDARLSLDSKPLPRSSIQWNEDGSESTEKAVENEVAFSVDADGKEAGIVQLAERCPSASTLHGENRELEHPLHTTQQRGLTLSKPDVSINA